MPDPGPSVANCPTCGSTSVGGQLVPGGNAAGGFLTGLLTDDAAAAIAVAQGGPLRLTAFCLNCGSTWSPTDLYAVRSLKGEFGNGTQRDTQSRLEAMVKQGSGFLAGSSDAAAARWARAILESAGIMPR